MTVYLYQKLAYRYDTPSNRDTDGHLEKLTRRYIGGMKCNSSSNLPQVGDIYYVENVPYEIKRRIFRSSESGRVNILVCEVVRYNENYTCNYGSDSWTEKIPLVTEISDEEPMEVIEDDGQRSAEDTE